MGNEIKVRVKNYSQFLSGLSNAMDDETTQCNGDPGERPGFR